MLVWLIVIVLVLLFLIIPLGVEMVFQDRQLRLNLKIGFLKLRILPGKEKKQPKEPKPKKEKVKVPKDQKKLKLNRHDYFELLRVVFRALGRTRKHVSIDRLKLYWTAAADDPCDAVIQYGGLNAGLSTLMPYVHEVLKIRDEDIRTSVDFERQEPDIDAELTATLQIWEVLYVGNCAFASIFIWYIRKKKLDRVGSNAAAQKGSE